MLRSWISKHRFLAVVIAIAMAILLATAISLFIPLYGEICSKNEYTDAKECPSYHIAFVFFWQIIKATNDYGAAITALATVAIGCFTYTLKNTSVEQGRLTRNAIEISRQGLTIAQWPLLYIDEQRFITPISRPSASNLVQFTYKATIHGQSPGRLRAIYGEFFFDTNIPRVPPARNRWRVAGGIHKPGFALEETIRWDGDEIISTPQERAAARAAGKWLFAVGCIVYDDLFGNQHEFAFCYRGALGGGWGIRAGGEAYNYHRLRDDAERTQIDMLATPTPIEPPEPPAPLVAGKDIPV